MSYRSDKPAPPNCPRCEQPAVAYDPFGDWYFCPTRHAFDVPIRDRHRFDNCELAGFGPAEAKEPTP